MTPQILLAYNNKHLFSNSQVGQLRFGRFWLIFAGPSQVQPRLATGCRPVVLHGSRSRTCSHLYTAHISRLAFLMTITEIGEGDLNHVSTFKVFSYHVSQDSTGQCKSFGTGKCTVFALHKDVQSHSKGHGHIILL